MKEFFKQFFGLVAMTVFIAIVLLWVAAVMVLPAAIIKWGLMLLLT